MRAASRFQTVLALICGLLWASGASVKAEEGAQGKKEGTAQAHPGRVGTLSPDEARRAARARERAGSNKATTVPTSERTEQSTKIAPARRQETTRSTRRITMPRQRSQEARRIPERPPRNVERLQPSGPSRLPGRRMARDLDWDPRVRIARPYVEFYRVRPDEEEIGPMGPGRGIVVQRPLPPRGFPPYPGDVDDEY